MKKQGKRMLAFLLIFFMVFSIMPVNAETVSSENDNSELVSEIETDESSEEIVKDQKATSSSEETVGELEASVSDMEEEEKTTDTENDTNAFTIQMDKLDVSGVRPNNFTLDAEEEVNETDPAVAAVKEELDDMRVQDEEGNSVALTDEQIQTILTLFSQYQKQEEENADLFGVQNPFYLQYNDKKEDGLGILGEMLVLAGKSVDQVRSGEYGYDDVIGMIQNFYYGDQLGIQFYGDDIREKRDQALRTVTESGAKTDLQKILVLNDWIAANISFDMAYVMNMDKEEPVVVAEEPQKHQHYDEIYNTMYDVYEEQITKQFHDQIYDGIVDDLRQQYYEGAIKNIVYTQALGKDEADATEEEKQEANQVAEDYMTENKDAISKDAAGFVESNFGPEAAAQISTGADEFIADAKENGVALDSGKPDEKTSLEDLTQQTMDNEKIVDLDQDGTPETTANDAIPIYAKGAAEGLTDGILGYWEGNHIGALAEGKAVCMGYSKAFSYLMQCMYPKYYGISGDTTDMTVASNWKQPEDIYYNADGELDIHADYNVDLVRITFDAEIVMYGEKQPNFTSDHFWNAVKLDGEWYYVDPCYTDIYSETMDRMRVETDGFMNHLYFMFSHASAASMYDGYYKEIKTLYSGEASDNKQYEDAWVSRVKCNTVSDGSYFYYVYESTDLISLLEQYNENPSEVEMKETIYKLVRHAITDQDKVGEDKNGEPIGDSDYESLIEFNYKENETDEKSVARVYNPKTKAMEKNDLVTKIYAQHEEEAGIYPNLNITTVLSDNKLYFNLSNCILSYDLSTGNVALVKEYNTVYAKKDKSIAYGGMAFYVVDTKEEADFTVENHPVTGLGLKENGDLKVSIATNFSFISGKDAHNFEDNDSFGYEFEESNYDPNYNSYFNQSDEWQVMGYGNNENDNDEFMWAANFVDTLKMDHFTGTDHTYREVEINPYCGRNGYKENRCTTCGVIEEGSREETEDSACEHHYIHFEEEYYTKDSNKNWNTGDCYVCTTCGYALSEPIEPTRSTDMSEEDYKKAQEIYENKKADYEKVKESSGHTYVPTDAQWAEDSRTVTFSRLECSATCPKRQNVLDCLIADGKAVVTLSEKITAQAVVTAVEGEDCTEGGLTTYTASGTTKEGYKYSVSNKRQEEFVPHQYEGDFAWTDQGNGTYTAKAHTLTCKVCGNVQRNVEASVTVDEKNTIAATCTKSGKKVLIATATVKDEDGREIGSAKGTKEVALAATGHHSNGENPEFKWSSDHTDCDAVFTCKDCNEKFTRKCNVTLKETPATYTSNGSKVYTATCAVEGKSYSTSETITLNRLDSEAKFLSSSYAVYSGQRITSQITSKDSDDRVVSIQSADSKKLTVNASGKRVSFRAARTRKESKVKVIATTASGKKITAIVTIRPSKVRLTATSVPLQLKKSTTAVKIKSKSYAADRVAKWTSSNKKIAAVNSKTGKITAKKTGTVTITLTMTSGATAKCKVKVQQSAVKITKLSISASKVTLKLKGGVKTYQIKTAKTPVTVTDKVTFKISDSKVAAVSSSGKITAKKVGKAIITVKCGNKSRRIAVTVVSK